MTSLTEPRYQWDAFAGSAEALKWNKRDLPALDAVAKLCRERIVAVQAGGNLGIFAKHLAQTFRVVYVFEPSPVLFPLMMKNAPEPNIIRFQAALGNDRTLIGVSQTRRDGKPKPAHEGVTHVSGRGVIPTLCLDDLNLPECNLLYLDTEGYELFGLKGASETLQRCRPVVAVEQNQHAAHYGYDSVETGKFLEQEHGYRYVMSMYSDRVYVPVELEP